MSKKKKEERPKTSNEKAADYLVGLFVGLIAAILVGSRQINR